MEMGLRSAAQSSLQGTLYDLQVRAVVEDTMQSMLADVEIAMSLQNDLRSEARQAEMRFRATSSELALVETLAMEKESETKRTVLADALVKEIWDLSTELGGLRRWKQEHEQIVEHRDEAVAKLLFAEEQLEDLRSRRKARKDKRKEADPQPKESKDEKKKNNAKTEKDNNEAKVPAKVESEDDKKPAPKSDEATKGDEETKEAAESDTTQAVEETTAPPPPETAASSEEEVVALLQEDDGEVPTLEGFEVEVLLNILGFLDAVEILSLAQVNVVMYSRVDSLFGSGNAAALQSSSQPAATSPTHAQSNNTNSPTMVSIPPEITPSPLPAQAASRASVPQPGAKPTKGPGGLFSILQARPNHAPAAKAKAARMERQKQQYDSKQPLSAAMATSMAAKLTDAELAAIISMTEKLRMRETEAARLVKENEELTGKLAGTENVKDFLVSKVREIELTLTKTREDENKVTQQIASDQEVIAFLDGRVQELEHKTRVLAGDKKKMEDELTEVQKKNDKKIAVISDMLQYEKERVAEHEREWKATKKLLVKEIKSCRAQVVALQAERDGFKEQNERLKQVVLAPGGYNGSPVRDR